eukprot:5645614-Amphidinium_carterae.1
MQVIFRMRSSCKDATNGYEEVPTDSAQTRQAEPGQATAPVQTTSVTFEKTKATTFFVGHVSIGDKQGGRRFRLAASGSSFKPCCTWWWPRLAVQRVSSSLSAPSAWRWRPTCFPSCPMASTPQEN